MALDVAQTTLYQRYVEAYRNGDEKAIDALRVFAKSASLSSNYLGLVTYPADFGYLQQAFTTSNGKYDTVLEILHSELEYYTTSKISPISATNARLIQELSGLQLYPKTNIDIELHYLAKPSTPVMVYSTDSNNEITGITGSGLLFTVTSVNGSGGITGVIKNSGGTGYVDGTYNVPMVNITGNGSGAVFSIAVANGVVAGYSIVTAGTGYSSTPTISTLNILSSTELDFTPPFYIEIMNIALMYIGINLSQQELLQIIGGVSK